MIGKREWFQRRKYGGWGLTPKTWQAWAYIGAAALVAAGLSNLPGVNEEIQRWFTYGFLAVVSFDLMHVMATLKKDEMEIKIEALAERNAAWAMIAVIAGGIVYQATQSAITGISQMDPFLVVILVSGVLAKSVTNLWLEKKGI